MSITTRAALKAQFKTGAIPTSQDFFNLIDSTLVRRDDAFFGKWAAGTCYYEGDVVIYNNALYTCVPAGDKPCGCEGKEGDTKADKSKGHCSVDNPEIDCTNWKMLDIDASDEDWEIVRNEDKVPVIMYAKVFGKIGMGTEDPKARVHIHADEVKGDFLFSPDNAQTPEFVIQQTGGEAPTQSLSEKIADNKAVFTTNTDGFLFTTTVPPVPVEGEENVPKEAAAVKPVFITTPDAGAAVGIGTTVPEGAVDIQNQPAARLILNPVQSVVPQAVWLHKGEYGQQSYLNTALDGIAATFTTNAAEGFYFRKGLEDGKNYLKNIAKPATETLVSIKQDGRVGIGTESPVTNVEITKENSAGAFLLCLDNTNPGFSIINNRPNNEKRNYLLLGADNDWGAFLTDASKGFVFKRGGEYGNGNELEINQGDDLVTISNEGKTIIGGLTAQGFDLNVKGKARSFGLYLDTDVRKVTNQAKLGSVIDKVKRLNPITFNFNQKANCPSNESQIGFLPHQVEEFFPELVNTDGDGTQTLAYANMVAVLTKAIQEQQDTIAALQKRLDALEGK
ncbi:tail fiber domain-containing protein [Chitinophaga pinensis]|uniref:Carbohydrate-binding family V/XII n=1 Tax=Chitinophaga pinensis (strain ATCC 43595 / DSM 2588 / LMG 13176 / NBRC 15968 / NCIMB 11800 / UQM 2034) TaxID=485918 RepID=A0A979GRY1_CHIPD|nr:tail fiber domain-containing protein [Chitinophaga pinensis]ACU62677.1 Carbohydrate-binding family V/XII [Chitinophaga pinensis DSM 2588]